jgi:putative ABC transport system substrate-binding protein
MLGIRRREFIMLLSGAVLARPDLGRAQTSADAGKRPVIGILALNASEKDMGFVTPFLDALTNLGYVDGKSATIVSLYAAGEQRLLPMLAGNLVRLKPDVIMADTASPIKAVRSAAPGIPIVGAIMGYPVEQGLIASFSHPGGNVTGIAAGVEDMNGKILGLGMEMVSGAKSMGLLIDPGASQSTFDRRDFQAAAEKRGIGFHIAEAHVADELDSAIAALANAGAAFMSIAASSMFNLNMRHIAQTALARRPPTITHNPEKSNTGILLRYGVNYRENYQRAATFVDKILKGAKPGDLPVEFPTMLEMVINMQTARALGITIPSILLALADEIIE